MLLREKTTLQIQAPYLHSSHFLQTGHNPWLCYIPFHKSLKEENWLVGRFLKNHRVALQIRCMRRLYRSDVLYRCVIYFISMSKMSQDTLYCLVP